MSQNLTMQPSSRVLKKTVLHDLHKKHGAKMVPFAGYDMPVQYTDGVKKEHLHTRASAGLFDVSHMGQIVLTGTNAISDIEKLVPVDIVELAENRQRYAFFTNERGGILDDLMISRFSSSSNNDQLYMVANAACKESDIAHIKSNLSDNTDITILEDRALLALQGPAAVHVLSRIAPEVSDMVFMDSKKITVSGAECFISRSGYTGEDGFEISTPPSLAVDLTIELLTYPEVKLIGLGARDSLRLESGLCLYGHDIDQDTTPVEASLTWAISKARKSGGSRAGGFLGAEIILNQLENQNNNTKRVGLIGSSRAPVREGTDLTNIDGEIIGAVTSGTFGPSVEASIAMAYIQKQYATIETEIFALVRGKPLPMTVCKMPFIEQRYHRG